MTKVWHDGAEVFEVGTRVQCVRAGNILNIGDTGTVLDGSPLPFVQWDRQHPEFNDANGRGKDGHCFAEWADNLEEVVP